jgi:hypothetical protein
MTTTKSDDAKVHVVDVDERDERRRLPTFSVVVPVGFSLHSRRLSD